MVPLRTSLEQNRGDLGVAVADSHHQGCALVLIFAEHSGLVVEEIGYESVISIGGSETEWGEAERATADVDLGFELEEDLDCFEVSLFAGIANGGH